ncbi:MAG: hypothetical protein GXO94_03135 [Nitrospirae bacterium]|nr:hypothetical protein [Nitrospirota bacterium]
MPKEILERIEKEVGKLTPQEQLKLLETISRRLGRKRLVMEKELDWTELYGLGKGLWKGEDAQEYVDRLRAERV